MMVQLGDSIRSPHTLDRSPLCWLPAQFLNLFQEDIQVFSPEEAITANRMADSLDLAGILPIPECGDRNAEKFSGLGYSQEFLKLSHVCSPRRPKKRSTLPTLPALVILNRT